LFIILDVEVDTSEFLPPIIWSFVYFGEIIGDLPINGCLLLKYLSVTIIILFLYFCPHRVTPLDFEEGVRLRIDFFHLPTPQQVGQLLICLNVTELICYRQFFFLLLHLSSCFISNRSLSPFLRSFKLLLPLSQLCHHLSLSKIVVCWLCDNTFREEHLIDCLPIIYQLAEGHLRE